MGYKGSQVNTHLFSPVLRATHVPSCLHGEDSHGLIAVDGIRDMG